MSINLYASPNIIKVIKLRRIIWVGHTERTEEIRNSYKILVGKPEGTKSPGRPRIRWEDNIKIDLREIGKEGVGWIHLAQGWGPVVGCCEHGN
jgi:hypothetical protein